MERLIAPALPLLASSEVENVRWLRQSVVAALRYHLELDVSMFGTSLLRQGDLFPAPPPLVPPEARAISAFLRTARRNVFALAVERFLAGTKPVDAGPFDGGVGEDTGLRYATTCFEIFGRPGVQDSPLAARSLREHLQSLGQRSQAVQLRLAHELLFGREEQLLRALSPAAARDRATRGRPRRDPMGILRAVALLRHAGVPERQFHRFWRLMPPSWACGAWSTFVQRRETWQRGDPSPWSHVMAMLRGV